MVTHAPDFQLAVVMADIALVLAAGLLLARPLRRLRQPPVVAEIAAGITLGPSVLGLLPGDLPQRIFPAVGRPLLSAIAEVGLLLFMFLVGWELDLPSLRGRRSSVAAVSLSSMAVPFLLGSALAVALYGGHSQVHGHRVDRLPFVLFIGTAMSITAFPVLARILVEHRLQFTAPGQLAMTSAAVGDVLAWSMLAVVTTVAATNESRGLLSAVGGSAVFLALLGVVVRPLLCRWMARGTAGGRPAPALLAVICAGILLSGYVTSWIGIDAIFGAFAFGVISPRQPQAYLKRQLKEPLEKAGSLLLPVFFVVSGLSVDLRQLGAGGSVELLAVVAVACVGKLFGAAVPAKLTGLDWRDARLVAVLMNTRGLTELVILKVGVELGVLDGRMFTVMVVMALATTMMAGPLLPRRAGR
ncbi:cation:proton antiporter [Kitasatospora aureofaciens]|uniref:cation:proton antiporter domain-containing protein n=1 Tax=Kitasatospora aureofaciens TaxID=1894 RepID=UPI0033E00360